MGTSPTSRHEPAPLTPAQVAQQVAKRSPIPPMLGPLGMFGVGGAFLGAIKFVMDQETVSKVNTLLHEAEEALDAARTELESITRAGAGTFWWASQLSHHSGLAHERLDDSLVEMTTTLELFKEGMATAMKAITAADENAALLQYQLADQCTTADNATPAAPYCGVQP